MCSSCSLPQHGLCTSMCIQSACVCGSGKKLQYTIRSFFGVFLWIPNKCSSITCKANQDMHVVCSLGWGLQEGIRIRRGRKRGFVRTTKSQVSKPTLPMWCSEPPQDWPAGSPGWTRGRCGQVLGVPELQNCELNKPLFSANLSAYRIKLKQQEEGGEEEQAKSQRQLEQGWYNLISSIWNLFIFLPILQILLVNNNRNDRLEFQTLALACLTVCRKQSENNQTSAFSNNITKTSKDSFLVSASFLMYSYAIP